MSSLPYDILRMILSSEDVPCSTKVELQRELGALAGKVKVSDELRAKLDRINKSRQPRVLLNGLSTECCNIVSEDRKITFRIVRVSGEPYMSYIFQIKRKGGHTLTVSRENVFGENNWYTSRR